MMTQTQRTPWGTWLSYHHARCEVWRGLAEGLYGETYAVSRSVGDGIVLRRARGEFEANPPGEWWTWCVYRDPIVPAYIEEYAGRLRFVRVRGRGLAQVYVTDEITSLWRVLGVDTDLDRFVRRPKVVGLVGSTGRGNIDDLRGDLNLLALDLIERFMPTRDLDVGRQWARYLERSVGWAFVNYYQHHKPWVSWDFVEPYVTPGRAVHTCNMSGTDAGVLHRFTSYPCPTPLARDEVTLKPYQWNQWLAKRKAHPQPVSKGSRPSRVKLA